MTTIYIYLCVITNNCCGKLKENWKSILHIRKQILIFINNYYLIYFDNNYSDRRTVRKLGVIFWQLEIFSQTSAFALILITKD